MTTTAAATATVAAGSGGRPSGRRRTRRAVASAHERADDSEPRHGPRHGGVGVVADVAMAHRHAGQERHGEAGSPFTPAPAARRAGAPRARRPRTTPGRRRSTAWRSPGRARRGSARASSLSGTTPAPTSLDTTTVQPARAAAHAATASAVGQHGRLVVAVHHPVGHPERQAVDEHDGVVGQRAASGVEQAPRRLHRGPRRRPVGAVAGDALDHLVVDRPRP